MTEIVNLSRLEDHANRLVDAAQKAGAEACDVVVARGQSLSIGIRDGIIEDTGRSEADGYSLRVFVGDRVASVTANDSTDFGALAERAVAMAKVSPADPFQSLADRSRLATGDYIDDMLGKLDLFDHHTPKTEELISFAKEAEDAGLSVEGVTKSMGASASWNVSGFVLATSDGFSCNYNRSRFSASAAMVAGSGTDMERDYDFATKVHREDLPDASQIGRTAGERVIGRLNPRRMESASLPVIFEKRT